MFISFEGIDGSGKSTQARRVAAALRAQQRPHLLTREPGGTPIGDAIRHILLDHQAGENMSPRAELLLFCASRAQLVDEILRPMLGQGGIVLCDRYADSTLAYQGYGHGLDVATLRQILNFATGGLQPELTLYFDLDPEQGLLRRQHANQSHNADWNRLDAMALAFHQRVRAGYEALISENPARWVRINAAGNEDSVFAEVMQTLKSRLPAVP